MVRENFKASIENFGHRGNAPPRVLRVQIIVIPPEHRLMLVSFHRECIGDVKKAQWDRGITDKLTNIWITNMTLSLFLLNGSDEYDEVCNRNIFHSVYYFPRLHRQVIVILVYNSR